MTAEETRHPQLGDERATFEAFFGEPVDEQGLDDGATVRVRYPYRWPTDRCELRVAYDRATGRAQALEVVEAAPGLTDVGDAMGPVDAEAVRNDAQAFLPAGDGATPDVILPAAIEFPRTIWALQLV